MPSPATFRRTSLFQVVLLAVAAISVAIASFEVGRKTVEAAPITTTATDAASQSPSASVSEKAKLLERDNSRITVREIATVPFSQLYDVLKSAPREQLLAWARDLEKMPKGPRQRAAVTAYYKSLIQVDHRAAIDALLRAENLDMRDVAITAVMAATPESLWGELNDMLDKLPHPRRGFFPQDIIWNWSRVDPVAVGNYIDKYPPTGAEDDRLYALMFNWAKMEPAAARDWLERDPLHQKKDAFRAFAVAWAEVDRAAAINYTVANASRPEFEPAVKDLAYYLLRLFPDDARTFILALPREGAIAVVSLISERTTGVILHAPEGYQRPPDVVARWMASLPVELWHDQIGSLILSWVRDDADGAAAWLNQMPSHERDAAVADMCRSSWTDNAAQTLSFGFTIGDQKLREQVLGDFARKFGETRDEAVAAINELNIPPAQKKYLIQVMPKARQ